MVKKAKSFALLLLNTFLYNKELRAIFKPTSQYNTILHTLIHLGGVDMDLEASFEPHMATQLTWCFTLRHGGRDLAEVFDFHREGTIIL